MTIVRTELELNGLDDKATAARAAKLKHKAAFNRGPRMILDTNADPPVVRPVPLHCSLSLLPCRTAPHSHVGRVGCPPFTHPTSRCGLLAGVAIFYACVRHSRARRGHLFTPLPMQSPARFRGGPRPALAPCALGRDAQPAWPHVPSYHHPPPYVRAALMRRPGRLSPPSTSRRCVCAGLGRCDSQGSSGLSSGCACCRFAVSRILVPRGLATCSILHARYLQVSNADIHQFQELALAHPVVIETIKAILKAPSLTACGCVLVTVPDAFEAGIPLPLYAFACTLVCPSQLLRIMTNRHSDQTLTRRPCRSRPAAREGTVIV